MSANRENEQGESPVARLANELSGILGVVGALRKELNLLGRLPGEDGFEALRVRMGRFSSLGGREVLVATLYGPTGAGKSTLFRLLTGIPVPAGDEVRPVSYASALAVPSPLANKEALCTILSGLEPVPLDFPDQLKNRSTGTGVVFFAPYDRVGVNRSNDETGSPLAPNSGVHLILADVPDFNSLELRNWERAEKLLRQAEVVVFLMTPDTYADQVTVRELERACKVSARMILVFTKVLAPDEPEARRKTRAKWEDLIRVKLVDTSEAWGKAFASKRGDGRSLLEFLRSCPVHFSTHSFQTKLESFVALEQGQLPLAEWLHGQHAERILLEGITAPAQDAVRHIEHLLVSLADQFKSLGTDLERSQGPVASVARAIASSEFPLGRMIEVVHEETAKRMPLWYRNIARPAGWAMEQVAKPMGWLMDHVSLGARTLGKQLFTLWDKGTASGEIAPIESVEARRIEEGTEILFKEWRDRFPTEAKEGGLLETSRIRALREDFLKKPLPARSDHWEKNLREEAAKWAHDQSSNRAMMLHISGRLLVVGGAAMMAIDLVTTGGLVTLPLMAVSGKVGIAAAAATGGLTAGALMGWIEKLNLQRVLAASEGAFREQRSVEIGAHLQTLWDNTFASPIERLTRLSHLQTEFEGPSRAVLAGLDRLVSQHSKPPSREQGQ